MNERSSLDIPGAEIYVGVVGGFYQSGWHSFAFTRRPGVGREEVLIRVTVTWFLESAPILPDCSFAHPLAERLHENGVFILWCANWPNYSPLSRSGAVLRFVRETVCIMFVWCGERVPQLWLWNSSDNSSAKFHLLFRFFSYCQCKSCYIVFPYGNFIKLTYIMLLWFIFVLRFLFQIDIYRFFTWKWFMNNIRRGYYEVLRFCKV